MMSGMHDRLSPTATRAVWWLDDGTGYGRMPVHCGWWITKHHGGGRRWRPWRPRELRQNEAPNTR